MMAPKFMQRSFDDDTFLFGDAQNAAFLDMQDELAMGEFAHKTDHDAKHGLEVVGLRFACIVGFAKHQDIVRVGVCFADGDGHKARAGARLSERDRICCQAASNLGSAMPVYIIQYAIRPTFTGLRVDSRGIQTILGRYSPFLHEKPD
jgi:hypothetical protein